MRRREDSREDYGRPSKLFQTSSSPQESTKLLVTNVNCEVMMIFEDSETVSEVASVNLQFDASKLKLSLIVGKMQWKLCDNLTDCLSREIDNHKTCANRIQRILARTFLSIFPQICWEFTTN